MTVFYDPSEGDKVAAEIEREGRARKAKQLETDAARARANHRDWRQLRPVNTPGFTRIPDGPMEGGFPGARMVRCDACGKEIRALGIAYHNRNCKGQP